MFLTDPFNEENFAIYLYQFDLFLINSPFHNTTDLRPTYNHVHTFLTVVEACPFEVKYSVSNQARNIQGYQFVNCVNKVSIAMTTSWAAGVKFPAGSSSFL
jgi:hypothetical protein